MDHITVSLEAPGTDWAQLARFVEHSGRPLWLEADGEVRGVLLPATEARRFMGRYIKQGAGHAAEQLADGEPEAPPPGA